MKRTRPFPLRSSVRVCLGGAVLTAAALFAGAWSGCTVTKENYATLSRFFDGVPPPAGVAPLGDSPGEMRIEIVSVHPPYAQEKCDECHNTGKRLNKQSSSLCLKCHEKVPGEHERMHGPVAAAACLWCHSPHDSQYPHLLRDAPRNVCMQCHTPASLDAARVPEHADESKSCLECHFGHGGTARFLLKAAAPTPPRAGAEK